MINNIPEEAKQFKFWIITRNMKDGSFDYRGGSNNLHEALNKAAEINGEVTGKW